MKLKYLVMGLLVTAGVVMGADAPKYNPSEVQTLRLQVKQKDAQLAQLDMQAATERFQVALNGLQQAGEAVRVENKWPDTVKFDPNTLSFNEASAPIVAPTPVATGTPHVSVNTEKQVQKP
jgi:hypothetical protein